MSIVNSQKSIVFVAIAPHPPIIVPTIGRPADLKIVSKTIEGMEKLAEKFATAKPETVIVISPHGPVDFNNFTVTNSPTLAGHFYNFGDFQTKLIFRNDKKLIEEIEKECQKAKIPIRLANIEELDHGVLVPLFYLAKSYSNFKVVPLAYSFLDLETHFKFGQILHSAIQSYKFHGREKSTIGIIASGDLSHRLTPDAPAGYSPRGKEFDQKLVELLEKKDVKGIMNLDPNLVEEAGECGYRSIIILLGALNNLDWQPEILSYEGPFGVGYLVANFKLK
ncbi:MAG: AmmeMemoRadiSam system protein B [Patescibacteria group bacterium]|nr:AmmeMemoRadiSam system protein B [Patescibacteria group bacterium]